jgi:hypothetical protein
VADNETTGSNKAVATDKVTYSGDADQNVQLVRVVQVTGSEGSKTVVDLPGDATNGLDVDVTRVTGNVTVVGTGTLATQVDGSALTALQLIDDPVFADDAAFTVGTSKVMAVGLNAVAHGSAPDAADAGDAVIPLANRHRVPFVIGGHPNAVATRTQFTAAQTDVSLVGTINAGTKVVVTGFQVTLDNASTVFPSVRIGFGAANTPTATGVIGAHGGLPAGGGFGRGDGSGIVGVGGDGEELRITTVGTATGNGVEVVLTYFTIES